MLEDDHQPLRSPYFLRWEKKNFQKAIARAVSRFLVGTDLAKLLQADFTGLIARRSWID
jgi:hypothetical protein